MSRRISKCLRVCAGFAFLSGAVALVGCASDPPGAEGGKGQAPPYESSPGERKSDLPLPTTLLQCSDQFSQRFAQKLSDTPEIMNAGKPVVVLMGDINNKTEIVSSTEFEMVRSRIRNQLNNSPYIKQKISFRESRARMGQLADQEIVGDAAGPAGPGIYDPATTFVLNADAYRINRDGTNFYYIEYQLVHFKDNAIVFSDSTERMQPKD